MASEIKRDEETVTIASTNPATLETNGEVEEASPDEVEQAVEDAREAQKRWSETSFDHRIGVLDEFQDEIIDRREELARVVSSETGKPVGEALVTDLIPAVDAVKFLRENGEDVLEDEVELSNAMVMDRSSKVVREPLGVVGMITPWNYPFGIPGSQVVYALFAGNAVVLKPSEETTLTALRIRDLFDGTGLPDDVFRVVPGRGGTTGAALVNSGVDHITFTGSDDVGEEIESSCAPRGVPTTMELGGSDPAIVLDDANVDLATDGIVWSRFSNCGQTCAAVKRVYVVESVASEVADELVRKARKLRVGDGFDEDVDVGPLISGDALDEIHRQVSESVEMGAEVLTGGEPLDRDGHFYRPTVLGNVTHDMPVVREETFGPVLPITEVENVGEAVEKANDSRYGLTASVWTRDVDVGEAVARRLDAGTVTVNDHGYTYGINETPWGGYKRSGHGRTHGKWGLHEVTRLKHIHRAKGDVFPRSSRVRNTWWFPYPDDYVDVMGNGMEFLYNSGPVEKVRRAPGMIRSILGNEGL